MITTLRLPSSNAYLIRGERPILVDTGKPGDAKHISAALSKEGIALNDLALILHTHAHGDHVASTTALKQQTSAPTAIHPLEVPMLRAGIAEGLKYRDPLARFFLQPFLYAWEPFEPDLLVGDGDRLDDYGVKGTIIHTPGHTPGSISVIFDSGEAIVGDVMMGGHIGGHLLAHIPRYHYLIDDRDAVHASIQRLLALGAERFYVGHGSVLQRADIERKFAPMMRAFHPAPNA
jgi:glyoxylase-like metal-dependent hydrolase (beta-lactamase superfamily II)